MSRTELNNIDLLVQLKEALEGKRFTKKQLVMLLQSPELIHGLQAKINNKINAVEHFPATSGGEQVRCWKWTGYNWYHHEYHVPAPVPNQSGSRISRRRRRLKFATALREFETFKAEISDELCEMRIGGQ